MKWLPLDSPQRFNSNIGMKNRLVTLTSGIAFFQNQSIKRPPRVVKLIIMQVNDKQQREIIFILSKM